MIYYILREVQYMYKKCIKRCLDFLLSLCGIIVLGPVLAVLAVLVRVKLGSPVLFKQERPGKDEKIFTLCKFRTMTDARDEKGELLPDAVRLTKFGKFLRATSLDELPELDRPKAPARLLSALLYGARTLKTQRAARADGTCAGQRAQFP